MNDRDERIVGALCELPFAERLGLLAMAVIAAGNGGAVAPVQGLFAFGATMARRLNVEERFILAERHAGRRSAFGAKRTWLKEANNANDPKRTLVATYWMARVR
jgi:hypothetical protein